MRHGIIRIHKSHVRDSHLVKIGKKNWLVGKGMVEFNVENGLMTMHFETPFGRKKVNEVRHFEHHD